MDEFLPPYSNKKTIVLSEFSTVEIGQLGVSDHLGTRNELRIRTIQKNCPTTEHVINLLIPQ